MYLNDHRKGKPDPKPVPKEKKKRPRISRRKPRRPSDPPVDNHRGVYAEAIGVSIKELSSLPSEGGTGMGGEIHHIYARGLAEPPLGPWIRSGTL